VTMSAGEKVSLKTNSSNLSAGYTIKWLKPNGEPLYSVGFGAKENWFWDSKTFATAGTYTLVVDPEGAATGSVDLQLWETPDLTGQTITPSSEGGSVTSTINVPGQRELVTFSGTASQLVTVKAQESTITSGTIWVLKPDGTKLSGSEASFSPSSAARKELTLPTTGTYTIVIDPPATATNPPTDGTGSVKAIVYLGSHVAWLSPFESPAELVSFAISSAPPPDGYSDIPRGDRAAARSELLARSSSERSEAVPSPKHASRAHHDGARGSAGQAPVVITAAMRAFDPDPADAWHPARTRPGVRGWRAGEPKSPWSEVAQLQAGPETTALAGQVLRVDGLPLKGVRVSLEDSSVSAKTDQAGRFLLAAAPAGHQILVIDGNGVSGKADYGTFEAGVDLTEGETTTLDYTIWLTALDHAGDQQIPSPTKRETRLSTPRIPGLEVRIPSGSVITDDDGDPVRKLNISAIPADRPPFPLPPFVYVPLYFTVQPGGAYLSKGAQIVYPNWTHLAPGQRVDFWNYDPDDRGWYVYGQGSVTPDGKQVMPDPKVRIWELSGAMIASSPKPPSTGPLPAGGASSGDPVDLHSGLFTYHKTDLMLPDTIPVSIERTYRPQDSNSYSFGTGTTSLYDMRLWSEKNYTEADLIMPDGGRVHYVRTSPGTGYTDAVYEATNTPGPFFGSRITWNPATPGFDLTLTNGTTLLFGEMAPLQAIRDRFGNTLTLTRASGQTGNITQITSPHGRWAKLSYDGSDRVTEITDNGGRHLKYSYTSGRLTKVEGLAGRTTEYEYDEAGRMKAIVNARGNKYLQIAYDGNGRVEEQTTGDGGTFEFDYDLSEGGKVEATTVTDPVGNQREVEFNADGFPISDTDAPGTESAQTTSLERQSKTGLILSETDPLGRKTALKYDSSGNVTEVARLAGTEDEQVSKYVYEPGADRVTEATDPLGHATKYQYGSKGELLKRIDPLSHETTFAYNNDGQPTSITNPAGETTKFSYRAGDLTGVADPLGRETMRFLDGLGRPTAITTPGGQQTRFAYNAADELTSMTTPSGAKTTIEYDQDGNPIVVIDPRGGETSATYDAMDRLESETDPLEHAAEWAYDRAGHLVEAVDRRGQVSAFEYDDLGRVASAAFGVSGETAESSIDYEYDDADRLVAVEDSASGEYGLGYDGLDHLTEVVGPQGAIGYEYDGAGRREAMGVLGGEDVGYEYDNANRLIEIAAGGQVVSLVYDKADRPESLTLPNGIEQRYGYDKAGQATSITYKKGESPLGEIDYAYDANGRTEATWGSYARLGLPEPLKSTEYNAANELTEREGKDLEYDEEGNLISDGENEYSWDARGQLSEISGATSAGFAYDPFGRRVSKTLDETTIDLLYDGPNAVQESIEGSTADLLTGLRADQLFSRTSGGGTASYLTNLLDSTIALADGSGEIDTTYTYDPFGTTSEAGEASDNPFQYTGRENDGTGLQYNRARYYSFTMGRFISQDPMGLNGGTVNVYEYAADNPLDYSDPSGLCLIDAICPDISTQDIVNASAGIGDELLSPLPGIDPGPWAREQLGIDNVEECSSTYQVTSAGTQVVQLARGAMSVPKYADTAKEAASQLSKHLDETVVHIRKDW
jgi:RHS repeat-associated protein